MSRDEVRDLKAQIVLLQDQLLAQHEMLEAEARRRIALEDLLARSGIVTEKDTNAM